jgi:hypothetical protein
MSTRAIHTDADSATAMLSAWVDGDPETIHAMLPWRWVGRSLCGALAYRTREPFNRDSQDACNACVKTIEFVERVARKGTGS